jgi:uncharacterized membrane protein YccC
MAEFFTLAGALAFGSLAFYGFWVLALIGVFVLIALAENEHYGWATALFAGVFVALGAFNIFNLYTYAITEPWSLVCRIAIYIGIGIVWGAFKWWRYCVKERNRYEAAKKDFLKSKNAGTACRVDREAAWRRSLQPSLCAAR